MQNALKLIVAAAVMAGTTYAAESSDGMQNLNGTDVSTVVSDVEALIQQSRDQFLGGEFAAAQQGFAQAVKAAPENKMAQMYLRTLQERDHRTVELSGIEAVDAAWNMDCVLRSYPLADGASEKMELSDVTAALNVETLFPQVDFPKGSSAIYQPKMGVLFVRNNVENLTVLESILDAMGVLKESADVDQVEVEAKFVEVSEGTLEELGFQWNFDEPNDAGIGSLSIDDGTEGLFANAMRGADALSSTAAGDGVVAGSGSWSTFRMEDTFSKTADSITLRSEGGSPFDLMISALDQNSGTDVLSAPRITTKSGEEATIRVGELHYYPEVYEGDSSTAVMMNVSYQDFEEKLLGIELSVTPEVDGNQITLSLNPKITELAGWQKYQLAPAGGIYAYRQSTIIGFGDHDAVVAQLPIFKKREIQTEVTIADGSTIGMGGLINEKTEAFEDRVPLMGSLPLVGRFFRNEGERVVKRNLLMFVTATKVGPTGRMSTSRSFE